MKLVNDEKKITKVGDKMTTLIESPQAGKFVAVLVRAVVIPKYINVKERDANGKPIEAERLSGVITVYGLVDKNTGDYCESTMVSPLKASDNSKLGRQLKALNGGEAPDTIEIEPYIGKGVNIVVKASDDGSTYLDYQGFEPLKDGQSIDGILPDHIKTSYDDLVANPNAVLDKNAGALVTYMASNLSNDTPEKFEKRRKEGLRKKQAKAEKKNAEFMSGSKV